MTKKEKFEFIGEFVVKTAIVGAVIVGTLVGSGYLVELICGALGI